MAKNVNFGSDTHISDAKMNPFNTFGLDVFTYLKHKGVQIKEKITGKTASGFLLFWQNTGPKKPVNEPSPLHPGANCAYEHGLRWSYYLS